MQDLSTYITFHVRANSFPNKSLQNFLASKQIVDRNDVLDGGGVAGGCPYLTAEAPHPRVKWRVWKLEYFPDPDAPIVDSFTLNMSDGVSTKRGRFGTKMGIHVQRP